MNLKYCLNVSTIRTTPILEQIRAASAAGYEAIELWHDQIDEYVSATGTIRDICKALDDDGLIVPTTIYLSGWFDASDADYANVLEECKRRLAQAAEIGAHHVIAGPPAGRADYRRGAVRYRQILELGLSQGVRPAMEFLGFVDQVNTIEDAVEIIQAAGHSQGTIVLDPFHIFRGGGSMDSISLLKASQIAISHFNDAPPEPSREQQHDHDRVMPGDGHLDLSRYVQLLRNTGYDGYLSLELFREELWNQDPYEVAKLGRDKMQAFVED